MNGYTKQGVSWAVDAEGDIELFYMNEQCPAYITRNDIESFNEGIALWKQKVEREAAEANLRSEQQDYQEYLRLKERFENK